MRKVGEMKLIKSISGIKIKGANFTNETFLKLLDSTDGKFTKASLVYGRNGSGKSTIAKAFKKIQDNGSENILVAEAIDNKGNVITLSDEDKKLVYVFDEEYVNENVRIREDGLGSIVMLGEQVNLTNKIELAEKEAEKALVEKNRQQEVSAEYADKTSPKSPAFYKEKMYRILQADSGWAGRERIIKELRRNASVNDEILRKITSIISHKSTAELNAEYEAKIEELKNAKDGALAIEEQVPTVPEVYKKFDFAALKTLLDKKIQPPELSDREKYLLELAQRGDLDGLYTRVETFEKAETKYCPYCLQDVSQEYKVELVEKVQKILTKEIKLYKEELVSMEIPEVHIDLSPFAQLETYDDCEKNIRQLQVDIEVNNSILKKKLNNIYEVVEEDILDININLETINACLERLEQERIDFNKTVTSIEPIKRRLSKINNELAHNEIDDLFKQYETQKAQQETEEKICIQKSETYKDKCEALDSLQSQLKRIDIATDIINKGLKYIFFSEDRLRIQAEGDMYRIYSNGRLVSPKQISVGERNIIGLCYFFTNIIVGKNKNTAYKDEYMIIIDDPISSYDFENRVGILSFLKVKLGSFLSGNQNSRVLVMTHDLLTYLDLEKMFSELQGDWKKVFLGQKMQYNLYELKNCCISRFNYRTRHEYTEMLKIVYGYAKGEYIEYSVIIGNIMRQVLEAFATFVYKKGIEAVSIDEEILDCMDVEYRNYFKNLMYRLVLNGGSHKEEQVRSLEIDFFSVITEEEKQRTAKDIVCFIYLINKVHIKAHLGEVTGVLDLWCNAIKSRAAMI